MDAEEGKGKCEDKKEGTLTARKKVEYLDGTQRQRRHRNVLVT